MFPKVIIGGRKYRSSIRGTNQFGVHKQNIKKY
jgi:hypothetical protein